MQKLYYVPMLFLLVSCRVGEDYTAQNYLSDEDIKANLNLTDHSQKISKNWFEIFKDDDLNTLLNHALKNNFTILQGIERLQQSRYVSKIHKADFLPMIDGNGDYIFNKANSYPNNIDNSNNFKVGIDAAWETDIWGRGEYISERYYQLMKQAEYSLLNIKASVTAEIVSAYIKLRTAQKSLEIAQKNLSLQQDILQTVKQKYNAGVADELALNQADFVVEKTRASIPNFIQQIEVQKNAIAVLLGVTPTQIPININKPRKNIVSSKFKYTVKDLYNLPLNILRTRPDIAVAEAKIKEQNAILNTAITDLYPSLNLSASFDYLSSSGKKLFNTANEVTGYTISLATPIWHWEQLNNNIDVQKHLKNEIILNYNEALLTALTEIKNAIFSIEQAYKVNHHKEISLSKMQTIMTLTHEKYINGLVDFTDVANAEQNLLSAQHDFIESNATILLYLTAFYKATGGGYNFIKD